MLGEICIPLLLFSLGVRLIDANFKTWRIGVAGAVLRPLLGMAIAWGAARLLGLDAQSSAMLLIFGALPPAVLNYVFAERYRQEPEKVASIVMIGNVAALLFISLALAIALG
jgi:malate permease and related proteins